MAQQRKIMGALRRLQGGRKAPPLNQLRQRRCVHTAIRARYPLCFGRSIHRSHGRIQRKFYQLSAKCDGAEYRAGDFPAQPLQHLRVGRDLRGILAAQPRTEILAALSFSDTVGFVVHNGPLAAAPYGKIDHSLEVKRFPRKGLSAEMLVKMAEQRTVAVGRKA